MNSSVELDNIIKIIQSSKKICIFAHESPDGDAIGSSLALYMGLKQLNKEVDVVNDEYSNAFKFLSCIKEIKKHTTEKYDLSIAVDCADKERIYDPNKTFDKSPITISIDHHSSNNFFANYNYVEDKSPAVCKTLIKIFKKLNITITKEIGEALITGIITDSGGFRYDTTDDETFEFAAQMLDLGVNVSWIYEKTFDIQTKAQFELTKIATSRIRFLSHGKIALTYITLKDIKKANAKTGDYEGIVNIGRKVEGVEISIFIREDIDGYRISLRSNNKQHDVSEIAEVFGGGGHTMASGCFIKDTLDNTIKLLTKEAKRIL